MLAFSAARADVITDGTMGGGVSVPLNGPTMLIQEKYGTKSGENLFHSFSKFEIGEGQTAIFRGSDVKRVISRVTGGEPTRINGNLISEIPSADVYLINPGGTVIGPSGRFDVQGSLHISTASSIRFPDGSTVSAAAVKGESLPKTAPEAFGFVGKPATIEVSGGWSDSGERVRANVTAPKDVTLIGGAVKLDNAAVRSADRDSFRNGAVRIVAVGDAGQAPVSAAVAAAPGTYSGALTVRNGSDIGGHPGLVQMEAETLLIENAIVSTTSSAGATAQGVEVSARSVRIEGGDGAVIAAIRTFSRDGAPNGAIRLKAGDLTIKQGKLSAESVSSEKGGSITVMLTSGLKMTDGASITVNSNGSGDAGSVDVQAGSIFMSGRSNIGGDARGSGRGADVSVKASGDVHIIGDTPLNRRFSSQSGIFAETRDDASGDGGRVFVSADSIRLENYGKIGAGSFGSGGGRAGAVEVAARVLETTTGGGVNSVASTAASAGGTAVVRADQVRVRDGGEITVRSAAVVPAGDLYMFVADSLVVENGAVTAAADRAGGGNVALSIGGLFHVKGGAVTAAAGGDGGGGNLTVEARSAVLDGGRLAATAERGSGGAVNIRSSTFYATPDSVVSASSAFGLDGAVRLETPLSGRSAPLGQEAHAKAPPPSFRLKSCAGGGRLEGMLAQELMTVTKPLGRAPAAFPLPGEAAERARKRQAATPCPAS